MFEPFCVSVVTGDDFVARLSRYCMDQLKFDLTRLLKTCTLPKYQIIQSAVYNVCSGPSRKTKQLLRKTLSSDDLEQIKAEIARIQKETCSLPQNWRGADQNTNISKAIPTFVGGRILYIEKVRDFNQTYRQPIMTTDNTHSFLKGNASLLILKEHLAKGMKQVALKKNHKYVYVPRWADRHEFQQIIVSRTMLSDHLPFGILKELEDSPSGVPLRTLS